MPSLFYCPEYWSLTEWYPAGVGAGFQPAHLRGGQIGREKP